MLHAYAYEAVRIGNRAQLRPSGDLERASEPSFATPLLLRRRRERNGRASLESSPCSQQESVHAGTFARAVPRLNSTVESLSRRSRARGGLPELVGGGLCFEDLALSGSEPEKTSPLRVVLLLPSRVADAHCPSFRRHEKRSHIPVAAAAPVGTGRPVPACRSPARSHLESCVLLKFSRSADCDAALSGRGDGCVAMHRMPLRPLTAASDLLPWKGARPMCARNRRWLALVCVRRPGAPCCARSSLCTIRLHLRQLSPAPGAAAALASCRSGATRERRRRAKEGRLCGKGCWHPLPSCHHPLPCCFTSCNWR